MATIGMSEMAQAVLTGYDTHLSRKWREEERGWKDEERRWRKEDLMFRSKEFEAMEAERRFMCGGGHIHATDSSAFKPMRRPSDYIVLSLVPYPAITWLCYFRHDQRGWHGSDLEQRALENARVLWQRFVEKNRRSVEEHSEQLKSISNLSALVAGFSVIGFLEFQFEEREQPSLVVEFFGMITALTVVLMVNSFVACSLILASILKTGKRYVAEAEEAEFMWLCRRFYLNYKPGSRPPMPHRTFEQHWQNRCEGEWRRAFYLFTAGVPCFLTQLTLAAWIKFDDSLPTSIIMTVVIAASIPYWAVVQTRWSEHLFTKDEEYETARGARPPMGLPFDYHRAPEHVNQGAEREASWSGDTESEGGGIFDYPMTPGMNGTSGRTSPSSSWSRANTRRSLFADASRTSDAQSAAADAFELPLMDSQRHSVRGSSGGIGLGEEAPLAGPPQAAPGHDKVGMAMERSNGPHAPRI